MRAQLKLLPNQLTAARLVLLPVLWVLAALRLPVYVGLGVAVSYATDLLDGFFARKLNQRSEFGSKFDSLADNLLIPSGLIWLAWLRPEVYRDNALIWLVAVGLYLGSLLVGLVKFRRFANLHLMSARFGSVLMALFAVHAFIAERYSPLLLYLGVGCLALSSAEGLLLQLSRSQVDEHMRSIVLVWARRKAD